MFDTLILAIAIAAPITYLGKHALHLWRLPLQLEHERKMLELRDAAASKLMDQDRPVILQGATLMIEAPDGLPLRLTAGASEPVNGHAYADEAVPVPVYRN